MISVLEEIKDLPAGGAAAVRIACLFDCYHGVLPSAMFWKQTDADGKITAYISKSENSVTLSAWKYADFEELRAFLMSLGGKLFCSGDNHRELKLNMNSRCGEELRLVNLPPKGNNNGEKTVNFTEQPDMKSLHAALRREFEMPDFETFYADVFYRRRKGRIHFFTGQSDEITVSSAMTTAESGPSAAIGGVITDENFRGQGLGSEAVTGLCRRLGKKEIFVCAKNSGVVDFYKKCGFEVSGLWTETEIY